MPRIGFVPVSGDPSPAVAGMGPAAVDPVVAAHRSDPAAFDPDMAAPVPAPVAVDPDAVPERGVGSDDDSRRGRADFNIDMMTTAGVSPLKGTGEEKYRQRQGQHNNEPFHIILLFIGKGPALISSSRCAL